MLLTLWLACKLIFHHQANRQLHTLLWLSIGSMAISCGALALAWSIMQGFEQATLQSLQTLHPPYLLYSPTGKPLNWPAIAQVLAQEFPEIQGAPNTTKQFVLADAHQRLSPALLLKGIDPAREAQVTQLANLMLPPTNQAQYQRAEWEQGHRTPDTVEPVRNYRFVPLVSSEVERCCGKNVSYERTLAHKYDHSDRQLITLAPGQLIIGAQLAANYHLKVGDPVQLLIPATSTTAQLNFTQTAATIAGIFKTGVEDFDQNLAYCHLDFLQQLFPDSEITQIGLKLCAPKQLQKLQQRLKLTIIPWQELYAPIMSALQLEKTVMLIILSLIMLLAISNLSALLCLLINQQRPTLLTLLLLGARPVTVQQLVLTMGLLVTGLATVLGLSTAYLLGYLLEHYQLITLPEAYLAPYLPVILELPWFGLVGVITVILGGIVSWLATRQLPPLQLAALLRQRI